MRLMADEENNADGKDASKKGGMMSLILNILVAGSAIAAGFATPYLISGGSTAEKENVNDERKDIPIDSQNLEYHEFGEATANIDEPAMTRYLKVQLSISMMKEDKDEIVKLIDAKKILLTDWLNGYLASQNMDSLRGMQAQNRLRREIKDQFNSMLFLDGVERIHGVYFNVFNVQ